MKTLKDLNLLNSDVIGFSTPSWGDDLYQLVLETKNGDVPVSIMSKKECEEWFVDNVFDADHFKKRKIPIKSKKSREKVGVRNITRKRKKHVRLSIDKRIEVGNAPGKIADIMKKYNLSRPTVDRYRAKYRNKNSYQKSRSRFGDLTETQINYIKKSKRTQSELAKQFGVSKSTITNVKQYSRDPRAGKKK